MCIADSLCRTAETNPAIVKQLYSDKFLNEWLSYCELITLIILFTNEQKYGPVISVTKK